MADGKTKSSDIKMQVTPCSVEGDIRLVYHSACVIPDYPEVVGLALDDILETSRRRNVEAGISGALIYAERQFFQLLEGPVGAVDDAFTRILSDKRHRDVRLICRVKADERQFERWPMAFLSEPDLRPTLARCGMNGAFDISRMPTELIGPFLSSMLMPMAQMANLHTPLPNPAELLAGAA